MDIIDSQSNDEALKLPKAGAQESLETLFHFIGHQTPFRPSIPPTSGQHDKFVRNFGTYVEK